MTDGTTDSSIHSFRGPQKVFVQAWGVDTTGPSRSCLVTKNTVQGHYTGYVSVNELADMNISYTEFDVEIDARLSYGVDDSGHIGFDCARRNDYCVDAKGYLLAFDLGDYMPAPESLPNEATVWTPKDVFQETERLAKQFGDSIPYLEEKHAE